MYKLSPIQIEILNELEYKGFRVNDYNQLEDEEFSTIFMSKKKTSYSYSTIYAEISPEGLINGIKADDYFKLV